MTESEKHAIATRLYVRLRHNVGRVTDAVWMTENADYAREVVRLSRTHPDAELNRLADRLEELVLGVVRRPVAPVAATEADEAPIGNLGLRYTGALR